MSERGSVTVLAAVVVLIAAVLALGSADVARVLAAASVAQDAADAAALAAAQELALPTDADAAALASEYAERNGARLTLCDCVEGGLSVRVEVNLDVGPLLLVPGERSVTAGARAIADPTADPIADPTEDPVADPVFPAQ
ncbi:MAG: Rv3654c family TadE-like protein [Actinomycetota bacterium]